MSETLTQNPTSVTLTETEMQELISSVVTELNVGLKDKLITDSVKKEMVNSVLAELSASDRELQLTEADKQSVISGVLAELDGQLQSVDEQAMTAKVTAAVTTAVLKELTSQTPSLDKQEVVAAVLAELDGQLPGVDEQALKEEVKREVLAAVPSVDVQAVTTSVTAAVTAAVLKEVTVPSVDVQAVTDAVLQRVQATMPGVDEQAVKSAVLQEVMNSMPVVDVQAMATVVKQEVMKAMPMIDEQDLKVTVTEDVLQRVKDTMPVVDAEALKNAVKSEVLQHVMEHMPSVNEEAMTEAVTDAVLSELGGQQPGMDEEALITAVLNRIKAASQSVDELETVESLEGIKSLPAMRGTTVVSAPIELLSGPAKEAAQTANEAAKAAKDAAKDAVEATGAASVIVEEYESLHEALEEALDEAALAADEYEATAKAGRDGATVRFDGFVESADVRISSLVGAPDAIMFVRSRNVFAGMKDGVYYGNFAAAEKYMNDMRSSILKDKLYLYEETIYAWSEDDGTLTEASGNGGGNTINVTMTYPLETGYYTLTTAIKAVEDKLRGKGRCITYEEAQGRWVTKQFVGTYRTQWEHEASWEDFGGAGTVKSITLNGKELQPNDNGNLQINLTEVEVDESLDQTSTNPVQNAAVTAKIQEMDASTIYGSNVELSDDESTVHVSLTNKSGEEVTSFDIPAGSGGGGGGESTTTKVVLTASVDHTTIKEGSNCMLSYYVDHQYTAGEEKGESTGQKMKLQISILRGSTTILNETYQEVSKGNYTLDLTKYLLNGTNDVYLLATTTDPTTGKEQKKQRYVSVKVVSLTLSSSLNISEGANSGGYGDTKTLSIPFTINGTGTKVVTLYVDGVQKDSQTITRSGTTNGSFSVTMATLTAGTHNIQLVSEMDAGNGLVLRSESIYANVLKKGEEGCYIGVQMVNADGRIAGPGERPSLEVGQYRNMDIRYMAYDPRQTPAEVVIKIDGKVQATVNAPRNVQQLQNRFAAKGMHRLEIATGDAAVMIDIDVVDSGIELAEAAYGLVAKWTADGRSNSEADPARWTSGEYKAVLTGFDWSSNGWTGTSLKHTNGAKTVIEYPIFKTEASANGLTIEMEVKVSNVTDRDYRVISCMDGDKGMCVTTQEASIKTGTKLNYENEEGEATSRDVEIGTKYAPDQWLKIAFTIQKKSEQRLMQLYINGELSSSDVYDNSYSFVQDNPAMITIQSEEADVEVRKVRIYNRWLSDDELLDNYMVDRTDADEMLRLYEDNDVIGELNDVDIDILRKRGRGVMRFVRPGGLDEINMNNNKNTDFECDVYFYSPFGKEYDFVLRNCYVRIQGTSSTKYPRKNYRIYMSKGGELLALYINGVLQTAVDSKGKLKNNYRMRPNGKAANLYCMKADYSDSSMTMNTGVAKLYNDVMKELGLLTPPQQWEYDNGGKVLSAITVRSAIDGFPIDVFSSETADGESYYYGQYNFNNEKSKSGEIFGMEGVAGFTPACPITLEMLNNTEKACLFQSDSDEDLVANFDNGCEFNYPEDVFATQATLTSKGKGTLWTEAQATACKRLWGWIRACKPAGADVNDLSTWKSDKFRNELDHYFDRKHLCTWYVHTDYFMEVDQRAKNMMLRTWDGLIWYITYYDGDTALGRRNDSFLVYDYTLTRDTYDASASKFAFEGRDSWLWNMLLANCMDDIKAAAAEYRTKMTNKRVLDMLNVEHMGNWSKRQYNKSGIFKYVTPAIEETYGRKWPFIYALKGSCETHRTFIWTNRAALLDAKYGTADFRSDLIDCYVSRTVNDMPNTIVIEGNEEYAYGYGTINHPNEYNTGVVAAGELATLTIEGARTINDPIRIYGASRMSRLDMTGIADNIKNALDLSFCTSLRELDIHSTRNGSTSWYMILNRCQQLRRINVNGQKQARTGSATSTELDLSNQIKLQYLDAGGTEVQSVIIAKGAPLTYVKLPASLRSLNLEYLAKLDMAGLNLEGYGNVRTLVFDTCPKLDWESILAQCPNVERLRVTGIDREDDGTWLERFVGMGGVDEQGNVTETCSLVGTIRLTSYMDDDKYAEVTAHFPELNIIQPKYSVIEFDDSVSDDANVSNLDNHTGYKYGNDYSHSAHVTAILKQRHRVLAKQAVLGTMTICQLHDENSNYYADAKTTAGATAAKLDGTEGDVMMYEPHYWFKGVNDYLNKKHYSCYSSNDEMPDVPEVDTLTFDEITADQQNYRRGYKILSGHNKLDESYSADTNYSVCRVNVSGYKKVRFPTVTGSAFECSVFVDNAGAVVKTVSAQSLANKFENGMYLIADVPTNAQWLCFTIHNTAEFDMVVLSNSDKIEDMEPVWVEHEACLTGVFGSTIVGEKLRSCISGGTTTGNMTWTSFNYYSSQRNMQQIDYCMHRDIANLFFAKYGRRDSQMQCGAGQHSNSRTTGGTAVIGMLDTVNTNGVVVGGWDNDWKSFYKKVDAYGNVTYVALNNTNCLGYEDIYGNKYDMMDGVNVNVGQVDAKWVITEPNGSLRKVKGATYSGQFIAAVVHGRYMDIIPSGTATASASTGYCDYYYYTASVSRVVYRGYNSANSSGGVSSASASTDSSYASAYVGSRLAFRGQIEWAKSVSAFKTLNAIA